MKARLYLSPLDAPLAVREISEPTRLLDILPQEVEVREWFSDGGVVRLNGHLIPPDRWHLVTVKPAYAGSLDLVYVPSGKKTFALLATVAVIALTAGIGAFGIPFLGAGFAAGTLGANIVAAGVGLAGSLLIGALTAPPKAANQGEEKSLAQAGVGGNTATILEPLPVVFGKIGVSPPLLAPPYTTWDGDNVTSYAAVGLQGRCLIENVKVNGIPLSDFGLAIYETREGRIGESARTMFTQTVIEERDGVTLSSFITEGNTVKNDVLTDQATPANSSPQWHYFQTAGTWSEFVLRFLFPSGIVRTSDGKDSLMPLRIEIRKKGEASWRRLPTFHFLDSNKGNGPMRAEIRVKRSRPPGGPQFAWVGDEYPIESVNNYTAIAKAWAYKSDSYFAPDDVADFVGLTGNMTGYTTGGVTVSASSDSGSFAWRASDATGVSTYWQPANNSLPAWIKYDFGSAVTVRSYWMKSNYSSFGVTPNTAPTQWYLEGSNDNSTWTNLGTVDNTDFNQQTGIFQVESPGSYRYYRLTVTANNGATNQQMRIGELRFFTNDAYGSYLGDGNLGGEAGGFFLENFSVTGRIKSKYVSLNKKGAEVYLDPASWDSGEYEIRVMRGWAFANANYFNTTVYEYSSGNDTYFFDAQFQSDGLWKIFAGQKRYRSDCTVEAFQTIDSSESPFDDTGIALVAVAIPNTQISSIYAEFTRYAPEWDGTIWSATEVPTQNPAALYRQLLLGAANAKPVNGESVPEDELADWFETCDANGYECNAMMQGARVGEAKQMIATAGYASPRDAESYGVVEDKDTTSDPVRVLLSPLNSRNEGDAQELADLPDAIRAEFNDAAQSYALEHTIIYREGMDATSARIFETISYPGFTDQTKVEARAAFDLKQAHMRQVRYSRRVGLDGALLRRGSLIGLSDETVDGKKAAGWITAVAVNGGGNVTSITLDNVMPWSGSDSIEDVEDFESIADLLDPSVPMGVAIRIPGSNVLLKQVSDVSDLNVCTFTTPFALAGSGLEDMLDVDGNVTGGGYMVVAGEWGNVYRRCKVVSVVPQGFEERLIVAVDEAPGLYS